MIWRSGRLAAVALRRKPPTYGPATWCSLKITGIIPHDPTASDTNMTKLTLQEQMLKAGLVTSKKMAKVQRTAKITRSGP